MTIEQFIAMKPLHPLTSIISTLVHEQVNLQGEELERWRFYSHAFFSGAVFMAVQTGQLTEAEGDALTDDLNNHLVIFGDHSVPGSRGLQ